MHKAKALMWLLIYAPLLIPASLCGWGTNNRADPFPLYTDLDPQYFLYTRHRQMLHGRPLDKAAPERVALSLTAFGQAANSARQACGPNGVEPVCTDVPIGDIYGRWNMIALLYGQLPQGQTYGPLLTQALQALFPGVAPGQVNNPANIDPTQTFGCFSNALQYRKYGVRWEFEAQLIGDFGFQFQGGLADVSQTLTNRTNLVGSNCTTFTFDGCNATTVTGALVDQYLMDPVNDIAREMGLNICSIRKLGMEDMYFCLYWRHAHEINFKRDASWARFLVIPFIRIAGSAPSGKAKDPSEIFSIQFTNNGHPSFNANAGINLDFTETIEFGGEIGYSYFFARDICGFHIPNSTYQSGIYPFQTTVNLQPGATWYAAGKVSAYHFIDRLNFWAQWVMVRHEPDSLRLLDCDPAFITAKCPEGSAWKVQFINAAFNYDCSPNITIGFAWQFPIKWQYAYKSNTVLFSFSATF